MLFPAPRAQPINQANRTTNKDRRGTCNEAYGVGHLLGHVFGFWLRVGAGPTRLLRLKVRGIVFTGVTRPTANLTAPRAMNLPEKALGDGSRKMYKKLALPPHLAIASPNTTHPRAIHTASWPVSQSVSQSVSHVASQPRSRLLTQPISFPTSLLLGQSVSQ